MSEDRNLHLKLTEKEHKKIRMMAAEEGVSMKAILLRGLDCLISIESAEKPHSSTGETNGAKTDSI